MGSGSHKLAGSYISLNTKVAAGKLLDICEEVAAQVLKRRSDKPGPLVRTRRAANAVEFAVVNIRKRAIMRFEVRVAAADRGSCDLVSEITFFTTLQQQMFGFIPAGPKQLNGWLAYSTFMETLKDAVEDLDRDADAEIVTEWAG